MSEILEMIMVICFGLSWPANVLNAYKARSAKGMSLSFLLLILLGYVAGIAAKFSNEVYMAAISSKWYVLFFYFLNLIMVTLNILLYFRNVRLDKAKEREAIGA